MLNKDLKKNIIDKTYNQLRGCKLSSNLKVIIKDAIDLEYITLKSNENNFAKLALYSDEYNPDIDINKNDIFDDFEGKNPDFNIYNSVYDEKNEQYFNENKNLNIHSIFKIKFFSLLFSLNIFLCNFFKINNNFFLFLVKFTCILVIVIYNFLMFIFFGILDIFNFLLFKIFIALLKTKFFLINKNFTYLIKIIVNLLLFIIKFLLGTIKGLCSLFYKVFENFNNFIFYFNDLLDNIEFNAIMKNDIDRKNRTNEHKKLLKEINDEVKQNFIDCAKGNFKILDQFIFYKVKKETIFPEKIQNKIMQEYFTLLEIKEKRNIINSILKKIFIDNIKNLKQNKDRLLSCNMQINLILIDFVKKNKEIYKDFNKKSEKEL